MTKAERYPQRLPKVLSPMRVQGDARLLVRNYRARTREVKLVLAGIKKLGWTATKLHRESGVTFAAIDRLTKSEVISVLQCARLVFTVVSALEIGRPEPTTTDILPAHDKKS